ncbi:Glucans biosynthesis protein G precursor [Pseudomonas chlororaphis subsp. aurantiaca]|uniref:Glucans biosynthesis protein G n=1 Tax=Pseudomonas chlororaphis subsp. aurantiaca TaxID=86192 RepID=A0AAJ0ZMH6_9PSED|nr:glucan biosynthesis protein G [Pseudomonas chlororaphis]AZD33204.1 Glucans biosynthesis protein G precursor [Pseudomonas chlororaphis subsp. aurantiaca]AZD39536.1 Glucans biosynthesis protein G precursor [Pseudomonas chlororaphis subsp. aurantiaca]AZD45868.1 Glucans biosynthesis protein G precursor [Pseudomonas chlororaphis subsp. aurantiaca]AZD70819.1 Glucans biosynthesis protein G precursor [Pseudomonas chlororaphis subsp. aurantiaca]MBU4635506.1 glucan biosynthesis protein [Pseudomonas c
MIVSPCNAPKLSAKRLRNALVTGSALLCLLSAGQLWAFNLDDVSAKAKDLAGQKYEAPRSNLPNEFREMKFADYQKIRFLPEKAEWAKQKTPFKLSFYHQGMHFDTPVKINEITANTVEEIKYDSTRFDFGDLKFDPKATEQLGYAGFRVLYPINKADKQDEIMTMLGASYFRVVGKGHVYGLSARGLAIDTALPSGEEFPRFTEFWIQQPKPTDKHLVIFALLDSPRATGAYRLTLRPGSDTIVDVKARMFLRDKVGKLGIAPLTSMFLFGANQPSKVLNYRRELHDSSGLSIHAGNGEWIWRPLNNPKHLAVSNFSVENPRGFGLLQRGRDFSHYEDLDDRYDKRPSAWIEPKGDWGKGTVDLVEIPTADETNDNIVAFWSPEKQPEPGQAFDFAYRLHWTMDEASLHSPDSAWVEQTLRSTGDVKQSNLIRQPDGSVAYLVDFEGPSLAALPEDTEVRSQVSVGDNAELVENSVRYNPETKGWRLTLRMKIKDSSKSTEMRAALVKNATPAEPAKAVSPASSASIAKADKVAAKQQEKKEADAKQAEAKPAKDAKNHKDAKQPAAAEAAPATPESVPTEQVLTETWSYQLPADE